MPVSRLACKAVKGLISYHVLFTGKDEIVNPFEKMLEPPAASYFCTVEESCCQEEESVTESYVRDIIDYLEIGYTK